MNDYQENYASSRNYIVSDAAYLLFEIKVASYWCLHNCKNQENKELALIHLSCIKILS